MPPLDLSSLAKPTQHIVPILNRSFQLNKKPYRVDAQDGWALVEIENNHAKYLSEAVLEESQKGFDYVVGYTHNNDILFQNFDAAKRKYQKQISAPLQFNGSLTFEAIRAVAWEDGRFYWVGPNYKDLMILDVKAIYDEDKPLIEAKGVTPELRTLFLFHSLEKEQLKKILAEKTAKEEHETKMLEIPYRLKVTFENAGARLLNYSLSGKRIVADWEIPGQRHKYNSVIDVDTWKILECGYCMSGDDKRHNITSMVVTAKEYANRNLTYITRRDRDDDEW